MIFFYTTTQFYNIDRKNVNLQIETNVAKRIERGPNPESERWWYKSLKMKISLNTATELAIS